MATNPVTPYDKTSDVFIIQDQTTKQNKARSFPEVITAHKSTTAQAQAGVDDTTLITPLKLNEGVTAILSNPAAPIPAAVTAALLGKEDLINKATTLASPNDTKYPTTKAVADAIAAIPAALPTNLTITAAPTKVTINSSTGTPTDLPLADATNAGLLAPAEKTFINSNHSQVNNTFGTITDTNPDASTTNAVANWGYLADGTPANVDRLYMADTAGNLNKTVTLPNLKIALGVPTPLIYDAVAFLGTDALNSASNPVRFNPATNTDVLTGSDNSKTITSASLESKSATIAEATAAGTPTTNKKLINKQDLDAVITANNASLPRVVSVGTPTLSGTNVLTIPYTDELGAVQTRTVNLSALAIDVQVSAVSYNAATKTINITESNGDVNYIVVTDLFNPDQVTDQISLLGTGTGGDPFRIAFADINVTNIGTDTTLAINTQELKNQIQTNQYKRGIAQLQGNSGATDSNGNILTDVYFATLDYPIAALEDKQEFILSFDSDSQSIEDPNNPGSFYAQYINVDSTGVRPLQIETRDGGTAFRDLRSYDIRKNSVHTVVYNKARDIFQLVDRAEALPVDLSTKQDIGNIAQIAQIAGNTTTSRRVRVTDQGFNTDIFVDDFFSSLPTKDTAGKIILPVPTDSFRSGTGTTLPDGTTDTTENVSRIGKTGFGVVDASTVKSNLETQGSFGANMVETNAATYNVLDTDHTIFLLGLNQVINLPVAATVLRRIIVITNPSSTPASTNLAYSNVATGLGTTVIPGFSTVMIQAGNGAWRQINNRGTVAPVAGTYSNTSGNDKSLFYDLATLTNKQIDRLNIQNTVGIGAFTMTASTAETILIANTTGAITTTLVAGNFVGQNLIVRNTSGQQVAVLPTLTDSTTNIILNNNKSYVAVWDGTKWVEESNNLKPAKQSFVVRQALVVGINTINHNFNLLTPFEVEVRVRQIVGSTLSDVSIPITAQTTNSVSITSSVAIASARIIITEA
jgi:hypothetical protein